MDSILVRLPFDDNDINKSNYTLSLLSNCFSYGLISEKKQSEILNSLKTEFLEIARQYTKGESSTITKERGEILYESVLYSCDVYLLSLGGVDKALMALKSLPTGHIIVQGKKLVQKYYYQSREIYEKAFDNILDINIHEYMLEMNKSFHEFYKNYSARFDAKNICTSIDYPLLNQFAYEMESTGVCYIKDYYTALMLENQFCSLFSLNDIKETLNNYGKIYHCNYTSLLINICQVVLNNFLARLLLGKKDFSLKLTNENIADLEIECSFYTSQNLISKHNNLLSSCNKIYENIQMFNYLKS
ncbi:MAG: hypothetical protein GX896_10430 [Clostridiales bacterium]|nr:hypothetical protein [Clostridiales bacterium]